MSCDSNNVIKAISKPLSSRRSSCVKDYSTENGFEFSKEARVFFDLDSSIEDMNKAVPFIEMDLFKWFYVNNENTDKVNSFVEIIFNNTVKDLERSSSKSSFERWCRNRDASGLFQKIITYDSQTTHDIIYTLTIIEHLEKNAEELIKSKKTSSEKVKKRDDIIDRCDIINFRGVRFGQHIIKRLLTTPMSEEELYVEGVQKEVENLSSICFRTDTDGVFEKRDVEEAVKKIQNLLNNGEGVKYKNHSIFTEDTNEQLLFSYKNTVLRYIKTPFGYINRFHRISVYELIDDVRTKKISVDTAKKCCELLKSHPKVFKEFHKSSPILEKDYLFFKSLIESVCNFYP